MMRQLVNLVKLKSSSANPQTDCVSDAEHLFYLFTPDCTCVMESHTDHGLMLYYVVGSLHQ